MEFQYSELVDSDTYDSMGLCEALPLRVSKHANLADKGSVRAQADWRKFVGPIHNFTGCLSPKYNGIAVAVAECLPDRLEVVTYANEFAFLHDDILDSTTKEKGDAENDEMANGFQAALNEFAPKVSHSGKSQMQAKLVLELLAIDRPRALVLLKSWEGLVKGESGTQHQGFRTLEEYLPHRVINLGQTFWFGIITYAMALTISDEEANMSLNVTRPAYETLALANDFFSWQKEYDDFLRNPTSKDMANAVWIIMKEHMVGIDEAKLICKDKIASSCRQYLEGKKIFETQFGNTVSLDLLKYLSALELSISGNVVWSQYSPRYNFQVAAKDTTSLGDALSDNDSSLSCLIEDMVGEYSDISSPPRSESESDPDTHENAKENEIYVEHEPQDPRPLVEKDSEGQSLPTFHPDETSKQESVALKLGLPGLSDQTVLAPYDYIRSLPSKGVRDAAIDALNVWYNIPEHTLAKIKSIISTLHSSSLMLDDIEDNSPLRRGHPSTHTIFGIPQTINSANFLFVKSLQQVQDLQNLECLSIYIDELRYLHIGQSLDLFWTNHVKAPTAEEYMTMVDYKTGGLFRMLSRFMVAQSEEQTLPDISGFVALVGRFFQIRDDYQNLVSADYTNQKGFCEDLDEGKFSLPLIHCLNAEPENMILRSILQERRVAGRSSFELKQNILAHMERTKSLEYTKGVLQELFKNLERRIEAIEVETGKENYIMRLVLDRLKI
ncbi:fusicoccadiene synthase [Coleophoma cylindrospora]|uniref:Fusicoccadiene synthase n=1 Tax=Coleophoma cylindrospora TaxID=1849047 RepID=A0A3D8SQI2_9HELO|nr:fusicoccadiene synthase [Coleophoma cylindrospora]